MLTFKEYLKTQKNQKGTAKADFIQDALVDVRMENFTSWKDLSFYLSLKSAWAGALEAGKEVWKDYEAFKTDRLKYLEVRKDALGMYEIHLSRDGRTESVRHDRAWDRDKAWMAQLIEYTTAKDIEREFLRAEITPSLIRTNHKFKLHEIYQARYDQWRSNKYGDRIEMFFVVEKVGRVRMFISVHPTARDAFLRQATMAEEAEV